MQAALELENVSKQYGQTMAVSGLTMHLEPGTFLGLVGRNGAGKTTTIGLATGVVRPTSGSIRVLGIDLARDAVEAKRRIGVMPQDDALIDLLTGPQFLQFAGRIYGLTAAVIASRTNELFSTLDLDPPPGTVVCDYSFGMKKKLSLAAALIHGPELLFLDEPFEGIDPMTARTIREILTALQRKGVTIVMSSHALEIVEKLCGTIAIVDHGRLLAFGTPEALRASHGGAANLEELFLTLLGTSRPGDLSWL